MTFPRSVRKEGVCAAKGKAFETLALAQRCSANIEEKIQPWEWTGTLRASRHWDWWRGGDIRTLPEISKICSGHVGKGGLRNVHIAYYIFIAEQYKHGFTLGLLPWLPCIWYREISEDLDIVHIAHYTMGHFVDEYCESGSSNCLTIWRCRWNRPPFSIVSWLSS